MTFREKLIAASILASIALGAGAGHAGVVTKTYDVTFNNFLDPYAGVTAPIAPVTASFTLTFDPTLSYSNDTTDITVNSLNVTSGSAIGFSTFTAPNDNLYLSIGGINDGAGDVIGGTNDFVLQLRFPDANHLDTPSLPLCSDPFFSCGGLPTTYASGYTTIANPQSVFLAKVASVAVPEPATWAIMLTGLAGLGATLRMRRRSVPVTA
jgi:hypothetical protein